MRVLIVDDHKLFAEAVSSLLQRQGEEVVAVAGSCKQALDAMEKHDNVDVVLMDLGLPDGDGISAGAQILEKWPDPRIIAVTAMTDAAAVSAAIAAGFHGYLTKDLPLSQFVAAVSAPLKGQVIIPRRSAGRAINAPSSEERDAHLLASQLTPREMEVLLMLVEGKSSGVIAKALNVSPNTFRTHIQNILIKLQVHSRLEAASFAVRFGIVDRQRRA
jgi:two-component system, NarL family, nitrate/nitrite response regulator NarL